MIERFRDPDRFVSMIVSLIEDSSLGKGARQVGTTHDGRKHRKAKPLPGPLALQGPDQVPADALGPVKVAREVAS